MISCRQCGRDFEPKSTEAWVASVSGSIMGEEAIETFYYCDTWGGYTKENSPIRRHYENRDSG